MTRSVLGRSAVLAAAVLIIMSAGSRVTRADHPTGDPVAVWNTAAMATVRALSQSDAQAARLYAMVNAAMYDAVNGIESTHGRPPRRAHAIVSRAGAPPHGNVYVAASAAAHAVLVGEYPARASIYNAQLAADLAAAGKKSGQVWAGQEWGAYVGAEVRSARQDDGSSPNETVPVVAGTPVGIFRTAWSGAQFRNLEPFVIGDSSDYFGLGPAPLAGIDYAAAFNWTKIVGDSTLLDAFKLSTYTFWSLGGGTSQPPGAWVQIALLVSPGDSLPIAEKARLLALVSLAMVDTVAPTVWTKFEFKHWRPATAIREADGDDNELTLQTIGWVPRAISIGTSPEYWSGHSSFSAAGGAALAGFFCSDQTNFIFHSDSAPGTTTRQYFSFSAAADEAGDSRVVGGIHFPFSNQEGLAAGRAVAAEVLAKAMLRLNGPTHFGTCPR